MLIPQGMAYAMIAGLPPVYGLYAGMLPQVIYAIFGTSRQLGVGAVAMDSLLVAAAVTTLAEVGTEHYITLALLLAFMMGAIQLIMGLFRMGFLVNFLSKPVISGFTSAAALIIGLNQLKYLLGIDIERSRYIYSIIHEAFVKFSSISIGTFLIGIGGILVLIFVKKINKAIPAALVAVILSILIVQFFELDSMGISIVGEVPKGLPGFAIPALTAPEFIKLIPAAATIALIAFMEAVSVAKAIQAKHRDEYEIDSNQELIGLGMANVVGSFFGSFPVTGGFSRSAVNEQIGAKTNVASLISATLVGLTLLFLTPLFYYLPKAILASVIMVAVFGLINVKYPKFLWKTRKEDFFMLLVSFIATLGIGIKEGIGLSVGISLLVMIYRSTKPHYAVVGKIPGMRIYRNIKRFDNVIIRKDILILRYDSDLYFANTPHFADIIRKEVNKKGPSLKLIILQANSIADIDASAYLAITEVITEYEKQGILFYFSNLIGPSRDLLSRAGIDEIGEKEKSFFDIETAVEHFDRHYRNKGAIADPLHPGI